MAVNLNQKIVVVAKNCQRYDLTLNYSGFKVEWEKKEGGSHNDISEVLVTDTELSTSVCDIDAFKYCNHNAKLCMRINYIYLYIYSESLYI